MRAALYCRISQKDERYDKVEVQEKNLRKLADQCGYSVVDTFRDDGISAFASDGKSKRRDEWESMLIGIRQGKYDVVLAVAPDRFTRNTGDSYAFMLLCQQQGVKLHTKSAGLSDPSMPMNRAMASVATVFAELDVAVRQAKLRDRFEDEVSKGNPLWGVRPFGYNLDRRTLNETEAAEVRAAYQTIINGGTLYSILKSWNERGILTTRGKPWAYASVATLLKRERNAGIVIRHGAELVGVAAQWDPIVSREDFEMVGAILSDPKRRTAPGRKPTHLLASIARCGVCGAVMRSGAADGHPIYKCDSKANARAIGQRHAAIRTAAIDARVRDEVVTALLVGPARLLPQSEGADVSSIDRRLASIAKSRSTFARLIAEGAFDDGEVSKELMALRKEEDSLHEERAEIIRASARTTVLADARSRMMVDLHEVDLNRAAEAKVALGLAFDSLDLSRRRELVRSLVEVRVMPGRSPARVIVKHVQVPSLNEDP